MTGIRIAHLTLKHRQGKNHKMRIVVFVGSPVDADEKDLVKLAKKLKKEKVNVDIVNFGESQVNTDKLTAFINAINGKDGTSSHLVTVASGPHLTDALISSAVIQGEDGGAGLAAGGGGFDPFGEDDPELALALRVSMEEQRQRQEESTRRAVTESTGETSGQPVAAGGAEEAMLQQALAMSTQPSGQEVDFASMTEDQQIAFALQMSMQGQEEKEDPESPVPMDTDDVQNKPDDKK
jgi:26S proteasome regulatory subunit N10